MASEKEVVVLSRVARVPQHRLDSLHLQDLPSTELDWLEDLGDDLDLDERGLSAMGGPADEGIVVAVGSRRVGEDVTDLDVTSLQ
jgi:hypothetical protein